MRTSELTGALLDYWVARAEGLEVAPPPVVEILRRDGAWRAYKPSSFWSDGGPLIEKYQLAVRPANHWAADNFTGYGDGDTPLQSICRAVVRAAFGDEVPDLAEGGV